MAEPWPPERVEQLRQLWNIEKKSAKECANIMGLRKNQVIGAAHRFPDFIPRKHPIKQSLRQRALRDDVASGMDAGKKIEQIAQEAQSSVIVIKQLVANIKAERARAARLSRPTATLPPLPSETRPQQARRTHNAGMERLLDRLPSHARETDEKPDPARSLAGIVFSARVPQNKCQWPIGSPKRPGFHFCGQEAELDRPYCSTHCRIAYVRPRD